MFYFGRRARPPVAPCEMRESALPMTPRSRPAYDRVRLVLLLLATLVLGIVSRKIRLGWPPWDKNLGDALYAVCVYLAIAIALPRMNRRMLAMVAFGICFAIELFQKTGIPMALQKKHAWVHWILGTAFGWEDVLCYAIGVCAIALVAPRIALLDR